MVRATIADYTLEGVRVRIEFDSGGPVGSDHVVFITNGEPWNDDTGWNVTRWFYFDEFHEQYARNFAKKVVTDESYRTACLDRTADWARISDTYEDAARDIFGYFRDAGVMGYRVGNDQEERQYREAKTAMERICEALFEGIADRIRSPDSLDDDAPPLEAFIDDRKDEAFQWLRDMDHLDSPM